MMQPNEMLYLEFSIEFT